MPEYKVANFVTVEMVAVIGQVLLPVKVGLPEAIAALGEVWPVIIHLDHVWL